MPLDLFRAYITGGHAQIMKTVPGLRRYQVGLTNDGAYGIGEAVKDAVEQLWFDDVDAALAAQASPEWARVNADYETFIVPRYRNELLVRENWILGPELRPVPAGRLSGRPMSQESFLAFLIAARDDRSVLARYDGRNLAQVVFHARQRGLRLHTTGDGSGGRGAGGERQS